MLTKAQENTKETEQAKKDARRDVHEGWFNPSEYTEAQLRSHLSTSGDYSKEYVDAYINAVRAKLKK